MKKLAVHKVLINAPIETVWQKLVDWEHWTDWDKGMQSIQFKGPLALGSKGKINLGKGMVSTLVVTEMVDGISYKSELKLLGSRYEFDHHLESAAQFTLVTFRVSAEGYLSDVFNIALMAAFGEKLPQWMINFKHFAEQKKLGTTRDEIPVIEPPS